MSLFPLQTTMTNLQARCSFIVAGVDFTKTSYNVVKATGAFYLQLCRVFHVAERLCVAGDRRCGLRSIGVDFSKECLDKASVRCPHRREPVTHALSKYF